MHLFFEDTERIMSIRSAGYYSNNNKENAVVYINDKRVVVSECLAVTRVGASLKIVLLVSVFTYLGASDCRAQAQAQGGTQIPPSANPEMKVELPPVNAECQKYDQYNTRIMSTIYLPSTCDSVSPTLFGLRDGLSDAGWGIRGSFSPVIDYDAKNRQGTKDQKYAGQNLSAYEITTVYVTYDLGRNGFPLGSQFTGSISQMTSSGGMGEVPDMDPAVTTLGVDVPLFDNKVELKAGYLLTIQDFVGMNLTGNAGSVAQGLQSSIPALVGMSVYTPTPTAEIKFRDPWTKNFYFHSAVARSISSSGAIVELEENPSGLRWGTKDTGPLYINEVGYRTGLTPSGGLPVWARAGVIYNTTDYAKYDGSIADDNYAAYAGLTMQLTKNANNPGGLNLDVKVDAAPSDRNIFTKDIAVNLFYVGPFESRPFDMVSVGYSKTWESRELQDAVAMGGVHDTSTTSTQGAISYSYRVSPGVYFISTASLVTNPGTVANEELPSALILNQKMIISF